MYKRTQYIVCKLAITCFINWGRKLRQTNTIRYVAVFWWARRCSRRQSMRIHYTTSSPSIASDWLERSPVYSVQIAQLSARHPSISTDHLESIFCNTNIILIQFNLPIFASHVAFQILAFTLLFGKWSTPAAIAGASPSTNWQIRSIASGSQTNTKMLETLLSETF